MRLRTLRRVPRTRPMTGPVPETPRFPSIAASSKRRHSSMGIGETSSTSLSPVLAASAVARRDPFGVASRSLTVAPRPVKDPAWWAPARYGAITSAARTRAADLHGVCRLRWEALGQTARPLPTRV